MTVASSSLRLLTNCSFAILCLWAAQAPAQSAGAGGISSGGATSSSGSGNSAGVVASSGGQSGSTAAGGANSSAGAPGSAGASGNLVKNGTFDGNAADPFWSYANNTTENPASIALAVKEGQLCGTMTAGGKNVWDVIIGVSGLPLVQNQYYRIAFSVSADTARTIKFKTGFGEAPYTDYFVESVSVTGTAQTVEYTYLNLRNDPMAQFQFQIGKTPGTVCVDNIVVQPVPAPVMPTYKTSAASGHPLKDYGKIVKLGTAVDTPIFLSNPLHNAIVAAEFSMITPANSMKMNLIQPAQGTFDFTDTDALASWAQTNGLEFRGHPLVWHTQVPDWLNSGTFDRDQMIAIMYAHIDALMGHYKGKFPYWDVVNEAIDGTDYRATIWHDRIGPDFMELAFSHARAADPNAKLFYNDYNIEQKGNAKADKVFEVIKDLKRRGIPIDGVGLQSHYYVEPSGNTSNGIPDMQAIRDNMARYAELGVEVQITECDFRIGKPLDDAKTQLQNKFYADLLQACIDAPNCSHFTVWGLSDLDSWVPDTFPEYDYAHLFDNKLMPKPGYAAMSQVLAKYDADSGSSGQAGSTGTGGSNGTLGTAGVAGTSTTPVKSDGSPSSSGGCSIAPGRSGSAPWRLASLAMLAALVVRRRRAEDRQAAN